MKLPRSGIPFVPFIRALVDSRQGQKKKKKRDG